MPKKKVNDEAQAIVQEAVKKVYPLSDAMPLWASYHETKASFSQNTIDSPMRHNRAANIERLNGYANIWEGLDPFIRTRTGNISVKIAIQLCQRAYYNFAIFRNAIDIMTEFSISDIKLTGGTAKSRTFFRALLKKLNMWSLEDTFFREYYRSGNVFTYRFDVDLAPDDIAKMTQTYGFKISEAAKKVSLPARYIILNPADIEVGGNVSFIFARYYKVLTGYEIQRLRQPVTEEEKEIVKGLAPNIKKQLDNRASLYLLLPLDPQKVIGIFYKKQSYEPMAVPMGFPVLLDLNWKAEMRKMDMAVTRTVQQAILLITMGAEPEKGGTNREAMIQMQRLFTNESVGRVLIADYTTKAQFIMPDIAAFLDPKKYEAVEKDIRLGLNNVMMDDNEKFANQSVKVQLFIERLKQGREAFLHEFLIPEIKRISKDLGFQSYPTPSFADINLKDSLEYAKLYTRLVELGILTADEGIQAIDSGLLPEKDDSVEDQIEFKSYKDKGLYQPITGGPADNLKLAKVKADSLMNTKLMGGPAGPPKSSVSKPGGRPSGTKAPQTTKKMTPIGGTYSALKVKDNILLAQEVKDAVDKALFKKFKTKKLDEEQISASFQIVDIILANEEPQNWVSKVQDYIANPVDTNPDRVEAIGEVAYEHQLDTYLASVLFASKAEDANQK